MPMMPPSHRPRGARSKAARQQEHDRRRRREQPYRSWYKLKIWLELRAGQLAREPLCQCEDCRARGPLGRLPADTVDHVIDHKGDWELFRDPGNLQSMHHDCHDRKTGRTAHGRDGGRGA